jgi:hypothetical protein
MVSLLTKAEALGCQHCETYWRAKPHVAVLTPCSRCSDFEVVSRFYIGGPNPISKRTGKPLKPRPRCVWKQGTMHAAAAAHGLYHVPDYNAAYCAKHEVPSLIVRWASDNPDPSKPDIGETGLVEYWVAQLLAKGKDIQAAGKRTQVPWKWPEILQRARDDEEFRNALLVMCEMDDSDSRIVVVSEFLLGQYEQE